MHAWITLSCNVFLNKKSIISHPFHFVLFTRFTVSTSHNKDIHVCMLEQKQRGDNSQNCPTNEPGVSPSSCSSDWEDQCDVSRRESRFIFSNLVQSSNQTASHIDSDESSLYTRYDSGSDNSGVLDPTYGPDECSSDESTTTIQRKRPSSVMDDKPAKILKRCWPGTSSGPALPEELVECRLSSEMSKKPAKALMQCLSGTSSGPALQHGLKKQMQQEEKKKPKYKKPSRTCLFCLL